MLQVNSGTEVVSNEDDIIVKLDQSDDDTEPSDNLFSDDETRASLQSGAKSSSGYHSGSSTDINETVQSDKSTLVCGTTAASCSHDLKQVDETVLGSMELTDQCE